MKLLALLFAAAVTQAAAQSYPAKPVKLIVPAPAGGGPTDVPARQSCDQPTRQCAQTPQPE